MAEVYVTKEGLHVLNDSYKHELSKLMEVADMQDMDILEYFTKNANKEDWKLVQRLYNRELSDLLKEYGFENKKTFNLAELSVLFVRYALERDLEHSLTIDMELGCGRNDDAMARYIETVEDILEQYEEEDKEEM